MSERWGDSQRDRDALDRHLTTDPMDATTRPEWEPGTLSSSDLRGVLRDALADLWQDVYRQSENDGQRFARFAGIIEAEIHAATNMRGWVEPR